MSVVIWMPRRYEEGYASDPHTLRPVNGDPAAAPYDRDTRVREITRYTGSKTVKYAGTGEFELTIPAGQFEPSDIKRGNMVDFDGDSYIIEDYDFDLTDAGYICTISGRDWGAYLDNQLATYWPVHSLLYSVTGDRKAIAIADIDLVVNRFFDGFTAREGMLEWQSPDLCGWFRDKERLPSGGRVSHSFDDPAEVAGAKGSSTVQEMLSYGALLRTLCAYFGIGYRWATAWDDAKGLYKVGLELYKLSDRGVMLRSTMRGVSGFKYSYSSRDSINATVYMAGTRWFYDIDARKWNEVAGDDKAPYYGIEYDADYHTNNAEFAELMHAKFVDLGDVPQENDASANSMIEWTRAQNVTQSHEKPRETIEFAYDNSGPYKFGVHFGLGSRVSIVDDFLGLGSEQTLTEVETVYSEGAAVGYKFAFGDKANRQADKIKKKFSEIDRRTLTTRLGV